MRQEDEVVKESADEHGDELLEEAGFHADKRRIAATSVEEHVETLLRASTQRLGLATSH
jgi:hypothetical protein